jgi:hypothetical protein
MAKKQQEPLEPATKFTRVYVSEDSTSTWHFDLTKFQNGPIKVEIEYTKEYLAKLYPKPVKKTRKTRTKVK